MNEINDIVDKLFAAYDSLLSNDEKYKVVSELWTLYYKLCHKYNLESDKCRDIYMLFESDCYSICQEPERAKWDNNVYSHAFAAYRLALSRGSGIDLKQARIILDWAVENSRKNLERLGIDVRENSLNGFCEIGQVTSLSPLEMLGINVTKNEAVDFGYPFNHCFGTVTLPILINDEVVSMTFLIDTTFRQFFSSVRCNEGRYYAYDEFTGEQTAPDPGYFCDDEVFARELMSKGYIVLNEVNAMKYGSLFRKAGTLLGQEKKTDIDYLKVILESNREYKISKYEMDGLSLDNPLTGRIV